MKAILDFAGLTKMIDLPRFTPRYIVPLFRPLTTYSHDAIPDIHERRELTFDFVGWQTIMNEAVAYYRADNF